MVLFICAALFLYFFLNMENVSEKKNIYILVLYNFEDKFICDLKHVYSDKKNEKADRPIPIWFFLMSQQTIILRNMCIATAYYNMNMITHIK